jgi:rubrerythrin
MYSKESFSDILQRILQFEEEVKALYDDCIKKLDDKDTINILQSISKEEEGHIVLARELMELIKE